jgi:2-hydroxy-3-oxopropionate reductase
LLGEGHALAIHSRRRGTAAAQLVADGARFCSTAADVAARSDVIFTMVTDTAAVEAVTIGPGGILETARAGSVVIDHSTISPSGARHVATALAARGVDFLDAPVSGGIRGAEAGTLAIMVGGEAAVFERCRPLLERLGTTIVHVGASGAGQIAKACNQICIVVNQLGVAEAAMLANATGVDFKSVQRALMGGFAASRVLEIQGPKMAERRFEGEIESRLHYKDIEVALEMARELGLSLTASALAADALTRLQQAGGATLDSAAVLTVLERANKT